MERAGFPLWYIHVHVLPKHPELNPTCAVDTYMIVHTCLYIWRVRNVIRKTRKDSGCACVNIYSSVYVTLDVETGDTPS